MSCDAVCLQGPTISPVFTPPGDGNGAAGAVPDLFGTTICVPKKRLYAAVNELRKVLPVVLPASGHPAAVRLFQTV